MHHNSVLFGEALEYYDCLLENASSEKILTETEYTPKVMQIRNIYMVDNSDIVLGVWNGGKGGTLNCLKYAVKTDKEIYILNPLSLDYTHINKK